MRHFIPGQTLAYSCIALLLSASTLGLKKVFTKIIIIPTITDVIIPIII